MPPLFALRHDPERVVFEELIGLQATREAIVPPKCQRLQQLPTSEGEFYAKVVRPGLPVVLSNASELFGPEVKRWADVHYLLQRFGHTLHDASMFNTVQDRVNQGMDSSAGKGIDRFGVMPVEEGICLWHPHRRKMTLQAVLTNEDPARMSFLEQSPLFRVLEGDHGFEDRPKVEQPELYDAWQKPNFASDSMAVREVNMWGGRLLAERPKESPLHYDPMDNLMLQLTGTKHFTMFSALDIGNLYPRPIRRRQAPPPEDLQSRGRDATPSGEHPLHDHRAFSDNFSPVDPLRPDLEAYPRFAHAKPLTCELRAGEALYMPAFTWHNVLSTGEPGSKLNLGVNVWFEGDSRFRQLYEMLMAIIQGHGLPLPSEESLQEGRSEL